MRFMYVPSMGRDLIHVSELNRCGYIFNFGHGNLVVCYKFALSVLEFCMMDCICWNQAKDILRETIKG
jgi:hypothetical protein